MEECSGDISYASSIDYRLRIKPDRCYACGEYLGYSVLSSQPIFCMKCVKAYIGKNLSYNEAINLCNKQELPEVIYG